MGKLAIIGWIILLGGSAMWFYGYMVTGHPSLINWQAHTPWWIADYLPNFEAEIGMMLAIVSMVPIYWPVNHSR